MKHDYSRYHLCTRSQFNWPDVKYYTYTYIHNDEATEGLHWVFFLKNKNIVQNKESKKKGGGKDEWRGDMLAFPSAPVIIWMAFFLSFFLSFFQKWAFLESRTKRDRLCVRQSTGHRSVKHWNYQVVKVNTKTDPGIWKRAKKGAKFWGEGPISGRAILYTTLVLFRRLRVRGLAEQV